MFYSWNQKFEAKSQPWNFLIHVNFSKVRELFISYIIGKELRRAAGQLSPQPLDPLPNPLGTTTKVGTRRTYSVYSRATASYLVLRYIPMVIYKDGSLLLPIDLSIRQSRILLPT